MKPPWEKETLIGRQRILTGLANETAWIAVLEKLFADAKEPAKIRSEVTEALAAGIDPAETRGLLEWAELKEAVAKYRDVYKKLYGTHRAVTGKSKAGRPSIWRGPKGWYFFMVVTKARKTKGRSIASAIRWVIKHDPWLKDLGDRFSVAALQVRYQEAADQWSWVLDPDKHTAMQKASEASYTRVCAAFKAWVSFHERESGHPFISEHTAEKLRASMRKKGLADGTINRTPDFP